MMSLNSLWVYSYSRMKNKRPAFNNKNLASAHYTSVNKLAEDGTNPLSTGLDNLSDVANIISGFGTRI